MVRGGEVFPFLTFLFCQNRQDKLTAILLLLSASPRIPSRATGQNIAINAVPGRPAGQAQRSGRFRFYGIPVVRLCPHRRRIRIQRLRQLLAILREGQRMIAAFPTRKAILVVSLAQRHGATPATQVRHTSPCS